MITQLFASIQLGETVTIKINTAYKKTASYREIKKQRLFCPAACGNTVHRTLGKPVCLSETYLFIEQFAGLFLDRVDELYLPC